MGYLAARAIHLSITLKHTDNCISFFSLWRDALKTTSVNEIQITDQYPSTGQSDIIKCFLCYHFVVINCGDPGTPANGERVGTEFTYGKTIIYDCDPGYQLSGSRTRTCQLDGSWSGSVASCTGKSIA